jgi:methionine-rich copper-binding protein CopC
MKSKSIILLIVFLISTSSVYAIGVVPSHKDIIFEPNKEHEVNLKITNNENIDQIINIKTEGDLSKYIEISENNFEIKKQDSKIITFKLNLPENIETPGVHQINIEINSKSSDLGESKISSQIGVISKINVKVPYPEKYAEARLFIPNFENQKTSNFAIEVTNLGSENIVDAKAYIDIYGPLNDKILTLKSESAMIETKQKKILNINWEPKLNPGKYFAKLTVIYDGKNAFDNKPFFIGSKVLEIDSISVDHFRLGGIAQFDILISNNWNEPIKNVYADVKISDQNNNVFALTKTSNQDIEALGKQELKAYWDTKNIKQGDYLADIALNYLDKQTRKAFDIYVGLDEIITTTSGRVVESQKEKEPIPKSIIILGALVLILIVFNLILLNKFRKR